MRYISTTAKILVFFIMVLMPISGAFALTANHQYTVVVDGISSIGTVTDLNISTQATTNSSGILSFSFNGSTIPTRSTYNFLLVSIEDSGTAIRRAIVPAPADGSAINLGISPMTESQTQALLNVMASEGTDNPMLVLFGSLIIRSGAFDTATLNTLSSLIGDAIMGEDGFNDFLVSKVGTTATNAFYTAIVDQFGEYTAKLKQAVEGSSTLESKNYRASAASLLSAILIEAAETAGFNSSYIIAAMKASSDRMEGFIEGETLSEDVLGALDMVMIVNDLKLQADELKQKYLSAMSVLDASSAQLDRVSDAVDNLAASLAAAYQDMEEIFQDEEQFDADADAIDDKLDIVRTAMNTAFSTFMSDVAAEDEEITALRTALGVPSGVPAGAFQFMTRDGDTVNWPITTVVALNWLSTNYPGFTYARATTTVPAAVSWIPGRTDFTAYPYDNLPVLLQNVFGLKQDLEILYYQRYLGEICASYDIVMPTADRAAFLTDESDDFLNAANTAGKVQWFESQADEDNDATNDADVIAGYTWTGYDAGPAGSKTAFTYLNDLSPFLTAYELQVLDAWYLNQETAMKGQISNVTGLTSTQMQAVFDALKSPQID